MDSFPNLITPYPSKRPSLETCVPDVSLLLNPCTSNSYRNWKNNFPKECEVSEYEWEVKQPPSIAKKQVRFDNSSIVEYSANQIQSAPKSSVNNDYEQNKCCTPPLNKIFKNKQFQEVYMANIPNRNLDLSLIDIVEPAVKNIDSVHTNYISDRISSEESKIIHQRTPTTYKEFLEMQSCGIKEKPEINKEKCITDIFNYVSPKSSPIVENLSRFNKVNCNEQSRNLESALRSGDTNYKTSSNNKYDNISLPNTKNFGPVLRGQIESSTSHPEWKSREISTSKNFQDEYFSDSCNKQVDTMFVSQMNKGKCDNAVQTSVVCQSETIKCTTQKISSTESEKNNDPTVKDLLKIIHQQNEQLLILQKQVASILECRDYPKPIEPPPQMVATNKDKFITNGEEKEIVKNSGSTPRKGPLPKFSIDLMTSFEVSFRPQQNMNYRKHRDFLLPEPKIQEITETESNNLEYQKDCDVKKCTESSLHLQNPINVQETCPSPEPSINIDMKDYEMSDEEEEEITSGVGSSFYRNLMDQVNKIIQNAQMQTNSDSLKTEDWRDQTLSRVKDCTIKHLRKIGMKFSTIDEVSTSSCNSQVVNESPEQISFAVKQLLMKYLPDDQLAKLTLENKKNLPRKQTEDKIRLNSRAPDFSFNTVQFMKKYDLIANDGGKSPRKAAGPISGVPPRMFRKPNQTNPKILDISSLKQQPKLL